MQALEWANVRAWQGEEAFAAKRLATGRGYWRSDSSERCWRKRRGLAGLDDAISRRAQPGERWTGAHWAIGGLAGNVVAGEVLSESSAERAEGWRSVSRDESTSLIHARRDSAVGRRQTVTDTGAASEDGAVGTMDRKPHARLAYEFYYEENWTLLGG